MLPPCGPSIHSATQKLDTFHPKCNLGRHERREDSTIYQRQQSHRRDRRRAVSAADGSEPAERVELPGRQPSSSENLRPLPNRIEAAARYGTGFALGHAGAGGEGPGLVFYCCVGSVRVGARAVLEKSSASLLRADCRAWIACLAGPREGSSTRESWLGIAAHNAKLPYRTVKSLYYGEIKDRENKAVKTLKAAAEQHEIEDLARTIEKTAERVRIILRRRSEVDQPCLPLAMPQRGYRRPVRSHERPHLHRRLPRCPPNVRG